MEGHDKERFSRLFMGASLSGSRCNYCSSLEQPASCWQIQRRRRRKRRGGPPTYLTLLRNETQENAIAEKLQKKKKPPNLPASECSTFCLLFYLRAIFLQMTSPACIRQKICTSTLNSLSVGRSRTVHLDSFFFFTAFPYWGPLPAQLRKKIWPEDEMTA